MYIYIIHTQNSTVVLPVTCIQETIEYLTNGKPLGEFSRPLTNKQEAICG